MVEFNYKKNDVVNIKIIDMDEKGQGIGKVEGFTLFVKDTVIGDVAEVKVMKTKKMRTMQRTTTVMICQFM